MSHKPQITIVGSSNTDLVLVCDRLPQPGETLLGGEFKQFAGGKGANQAVAAARAGARVVFVGARGNDDFGKKAMLGLKKEGINVRYFKVHPKQPSGIALILVGGSSKQNMIAVAKSANDSLSPADIRQAAPAINNSKAVVCQLEIPLLTVMTVAGLAYLAEVPFILNPAPAQKLPVSLLKMVHTLTPNEHEAALLTGIGDLKKSARQLRKLGCHQVVITLGSKGALICDSAGERIIPAPHVRPVDTVGAGDCFTAWLSVGLAQGLTLDRSVQKAVKAASISVTRPGAQPGMPFQKEV